jgi:hypothetical protein
MMMGDGNTDASRPIKEFFEAIQKDPRIGAVHIALYMALYYKWLSLSCPAFIEAYAYEVMPVARIFSRMTYYQVIKGLGEYGYIKYVPSRHKRRSSKVYLKLKE